MTISRVARHLRISRQRVHQLIQSGRLAAYRESETEPWFISREEFERFVVLVRPRGMTEDVWEIRKKRWGRNGGATGRPPKNRGSSDTSNMAETPVRASDEPEF